VDDRSSGADDIGMYPSQNHSIMDVRNRIPTLCTGLRFLVSRDIESIVWIEIGISMHKIRASDCDLRRSRF
jgi:hypothetical protein